MSALVEADGVSVNFRVSTGAFAGAATLRAVDGVDLAIARGEVLGLVGESGSGKTTLGRAILRLIEPSGGTIRFDGEDISRRSLASLRGLRPRMQIVFQDPFASLNPRMTVGDALLEPIIVHGVARGAAASRRVAALLDLVGLPAGAAKRYPHEFSGGQRQRVGIARALSVEPDFIVADEPVAALDVSIRAQIVNLFADLRDRLNLTLLFISHDLSLVEFFCDRVAVMYLGRIVELAPSDALYVAARHPYTRALLAASPLPDPARRRSRHVVQGEIPSPIAPPSGCTFRTRCPHAVAACAAGRPPLRERGPGHFTACIRDDLIHEAAS